MEAIKSTIGLGKTQETSEEPVSGQAGTGTTAEPYDAGNSDEAQEIAKAQPEQQDTSVTKEAETKDTSSSGGGGSWLQSAIPFGKKKEDSGQQASAGAPAAAEPEKPAPVEDDSNRPPNHLGYNVPSGNSLDFAPPQAEQPSTPTEPKDKQKMADIPAAPSSSAEQTSPPRSGSASGKSPAQLRGSRASIAPPAGTRIFNPSGQNPGRIPTAGGRPLGEAAAERRRSMWSNSSADEGKAGMQRLDPQGSPDPVTASNTFQNTVPQSPNGEGSSKGVSINGAPSATTTTPAQPAPEPAPPAKEPKPDFNTFAWGEGGEGAASAKEAESKAGTSTKTDSSSAAPSKTEQVKEKVMPSGGNGGSATKERRGSTFGRIKDKLKGKK